jgi:hypothetical protein
MGPRILGFEARDTFRKQRKKAFRQVIGRSSAGHRHSHRRHEHRHSSKTGTSPTRGRSSLDFVKRGSLKNSIIEELIIGERGARFARIRVI